jgi:peptide/nickel transport system permease protein
MGFAIMLTTSLSYLGLGVSPPQPDWGLMINEGRADMFGAPWVVVFPALAIAIAIVGFNMLGDGIRDLFDPRRTWSDRGEVG